MLALQPRERLTLGGARPPCRCRAGATLSAGRSALAGGRRAAPARRSVRLPTSAAAPGCPRVGALGGVQGGRWAWAWDVRELVFALDAVRKELRGFQSTPELYFWNARGSRGESASGPERRGGTGLLVQGRWKMSQENLSR
jgi:hypothetical protein